MKNYDLIVIGSGPAGEKAAVKAAYFKKKVALIEKEELFGGAGVVTGTLPSKTLKETALYLSGKYEKGLYGVNRQLENEANVENFLYRKNYIKETESNEVQSNLNRHHVTVYKGSAQFVDEHTVQVGEEQIRGDYIIIATGSYPVHPIEMPFDRTRVHDSDTILQIKQFPSSICVLGAGVIGCEYATIFSTMGCRVFLVNNKDQILPFLDQEISNELINQMKGDGIQILFNTSVEKITVPSNEKEALSINLSSKETLKTDMFLFAAGRSGNIKNLKPENAGIETGKRETIVVNKHFQTNISHIYAVGDVIGFPALASTSMDQGRVAVSHMFKTEDLKTLPQTLPFGIYTIPEISTIGLTEKEAMEKKIPYAKGIARYNDMPRGKIMGAKSGFLKLLFHKETLEIIGVHIIGHIATELIHYGMHLIEEKKTLHYLIGRVFNYPTLHDLYKYAAYDGLGTVAGYKIKS